MAFKMRGWSGNQSPIKQTIKVRTSGERLAGEKESELGEEKLQLAYDMKECAEKGGIWDTEKGECDLSSKKYKKEE